jgi:hypothetical protein
VRNRITLRGLKALLLWTLLWIAPAIQAQAPITNALNSTGVDTACTTSCSYTDSTVVDGVTYTYFIEAYDTTNTYPAAVSPSVNAVIPTTGTHSVTLNWTPGSSNAGASNITYYVFRIEAPTNFKVTTSN